jgi:hypothetical protein
MRGAERTEVGELRRAVSFADVRPHATVDYALRTLQSTLVQFSAMADTKASIMITVCSIVLTIGITQLSSPLLRWPLVLLTLSTFGALLLSILSVVPSGRYPKRADGSTGPDVPGFNPLFFGHFAYLAQERFSTELARVFADDGQIYEAIARDLWGQGFVLAHKKYRYLRWAYWVFLAGVFITICASIWTWIYLIPGTASPLP